LSVYNFYNSAPIRHRTSVVFRSAASSALRAVK
jgi:hypothetical protein